MGTNITLRLDEKTIDRVKHIAVDRHKSVSAWVGELVSQAVDELDGFEEARSHAFEAMAMPAPVTNAGTESVSDCYSLLSEEAPRPCGHDYQRIAVLAYWTTWVNRKGGVSSREKVGSVLALWHRRFSRITGHGPALTH